MALNRFKSDWVQGIYLFIFDQNSDYGGVFTEIVLIKDTRLVQFPTWGSYLKKQKQEQKRFLKETLSFHGKIY